MCKISYSKGCHYVTFARQTYSLKNSQVAMFEINTKRICVYVYDVWKHTNLSSSTG